MSGENRKGRQGGGLRLSEAVPLSGGHVIYGCKATTQPDGSANLIALKTALSALHGLLTLFSFVRVTQQLITFFCNSALQRQGKVTRRIHFPDNQPPPSPIKRSEAYLGSEHQRGEQPSSYRYFAATPYPALLSRGWFAGAGSCTLLARQAKYIF